MPGDYQRLLNRYQDVSISGVVAAADDYSVTPRTLIAAPKTGWSVFVQKVTRNITTIDNSSNTLQSITTDVPVDIVNNPSALGGIESDYGSDGLQLPEGEGLEMVNSAAGLAFSFTVQAYQRPTAASLSP